MPLVNNVRHPLFPIMVLVDTISRVTEKKTTVSKMAMVAKPATTIRSTSATEQYPSILNEEAVNEKGAVKVESVEIHRINKKTLHFRWFLNTAFARIRNSNAFAGDANAANQAMIWAP